MDIRRGNTKLLDFLDVHLLITVETPSRLDIETIDITDCNEQVLEYCRIRINLHFDKANNLYEG